VSDNSKKTGIEVLRVAATVAGVLLAIWVYQRAQGDRVWEKLHEIELAVTALKASAADGQAVYREFNSLRKDMGALPQEAPPPWFEKRVNDLEATLKTEISGLRDDIQDPN
jgi:hypothetical protein